MFFWYCIFTIEPLFQTPDPALGLSPWNTARFVPVFGEKYVTAVAFAAFWPKAVFGAKICLSLYGSVDWPDVAQPGPLMMPNAANVPL